MDPTVGLGLIVIGGALLAMGFAGGALEHWRRRHPRRPAAAPILQPPAIRTLLHPQPAGGKTRRGDDATKSEEYHMPFPGLPIPQVEDVTTTLAFVRALPGVTSVDLKSMPFNGDRLICVQGGPGDFYFCAGPTYRDAAAGIAAEAMRRQRTAR